jgi:hypothetical protein
MLTAGTTVIGLTPTLIDGLNVNPFRLRIHNNDNTADMYIGGSAVTVNNGYRVLKEESIDLIINPLEALYAVSSKNGHVVSWLKQTE